MAHFELVVLACTFGLIVGQVGVRRTGVATGGVPNRPVATGVVGTGRVATPGLVGTGTATSVVAGTGIGNVIYDLNTQAKCTEVERTKTNDCRWVSGLNMLDQIIEQGRIAAYKFMLPTGLWSMWFVPGVNDLDTSFNQVALTTCAIPYQANSMRRRWANFYDRSHRFIICKPMDNKMG